MNIGDCVEFTRDVGGFWEINRGEIFEIVDKEPGEVWIDIHGRRGRLSLSSIVNSRDKINVGTYGILIPSTIINIDVQSLL